MCIRDRVVPAAHGEDGGPDRPVVLADAAVLPVRVPGLVREPGVHERFHGLQAPQPRRPPLVADVLRVRRAAGEGEHGGAPGVHVDAEDRAAHVVHVVVVPVVGGADGDDRLQGFGREGGDLERVAAAPGDPEHADVPRAPGLLGQPVHDGDAVRQLGRVVLVAGQAPAVAVAAHVHPYGGVAVARVPGVALLVAGRGPVGQAVRQVLQEGRYGLLGDRAPHARVQRGASPGAFGPGGAPGHRDADVLAAGLVREVGADACSGQSAYSCSYRLITNIPGVTGRRPR